MVERAVLQVVQVLAGRVEQAGQVLAGQAEQAEQVLVVLAVPVLVGRVVVVLAVPVLVAAKDLVKLWLEEKHHHREEVQSAQEMVLTTIEV